MHIIENYNARTGRVYCYIGECRWNKLLKKYDNPRILIGHLEGEPSIFVPNKKLTSILLSDVNNRLTVEKRDRDIIDMARMTYKKYCHSHGIWLVREMRLLTATHGSVTLKTLRGA